MCTGVLSRLIGLGYDTFFAVTQSARGRDFSRISIITRSDLLPREITVFELDVMWRMTRDRLDIVCKPEIDTLSLAVDAPSHELRYWLPFFRGLIERWGTNPLFAISRRR